MQQKINWDVHATLTKYNSAKSWKTKVPDEVQKIDGNMLLNDGANTLWALVAGTAAADQKFGTNAYLGVGDGATQVLATDTGLAGENKMYMKMNDGYPVAGENQKIVFESTFMPGIACFEWKEWTIANGNGNSNTFNDDEVRLTAKGDDPIPDPPPEPGVSHETGVGEENIVNLNRKQENMGVKYAPATWVFTVEISLH